MVFVSGSQCYELGIQQFSNWMDHSGEFVGFEASMFTRPGVGTIVVLVNKSVGNTTNSYAIFDRLK